MSFGLVNTLPLYTGVVPSRALTAAGAYSSAADQFAAYSTSFAPLYNASVAQINAFIADMAAFSLLNPITGGGTSTSNVSIPAVIGTAVSFVITEANRLFQIGSFFNAAVTASPTANYMVMQVTAWNSGTSTLTGSLVAYVGAGGPYNAWTISPSAPVPALPQTTGGNGTEAGNVVLTSVSGYAHTNVFTEAGQGWTLPDGTTMAASGESFELTNKSNYFGRVTDSAGTLRCFVAPFETVRVAITSLSHATNNWTFQSGKFFGITASFVLPSGGYGTTLNQFSALPLDANRTLLLWSTSSTSSLNGVVYDSSQAVGSQWGAPTLISSLSITTFFKAILLSANVPVIFFGQTTPASRMSAIPLSIAGTAITPGAVATTQVALATTPQRISDAVVLGTAAFVTYTTTAGALNLAGVTVAANVATWGAAQVLAATGAATSDVSDLYVSGTELIAIYHNATANTLAVSPYSAVGSTLTLGTAATNANFASFASMKTINVGAGAWAAVCDDVSAGIRIAYITLAGTVATIATGVMHATLVLGASGLTRHDMVVANSKLVWMYSDGSTSVVTTVLTFAAGAISTNDKQTFQWFTGAAVPVLIAPNSGNIVRGILAGTSGVRIYAIDVSAATAVVTQRHLYGGQDVSTPNQNGAKGRRDPKTFVSSNNLAAAVPLWASGAYTKRGTSLIFGTDRAFEVMQDIPACGSFADVGNSSTESWLMADTAAAQANGGLFLQRIEMGAP